MKLPILRSNPEDQILYQTERYNEETFGYEVPIKEEGDYVLVLKFAEVYFAQSQQKVSRYALLMGLHWLILKSLGPTYGFYVWVSVRYSLIINGQEQHLKVAKVLLRTKLVPAVLAER